MSTLTINKTQRNNSVDIFRLICAVLVIAIHTSPFYDVDRNLGFFIHQVLTRIAVPFFFCTAGFYYINSLTKGKKVFINYTAKTLKTYVLWSVVYFLIDFLQLIILGEFSLLPFIKSCVLKFFVYGSYYHFWFFPALIFSVIAVTVSYKLSNKYGFRVLFIGGVLLYTIGCLGCAYFDIGVKIPVLSSLFTSSWFEVIRRYLLMGLPFFLLGGALNGIKKCLKEKKSYQWVFLTASALLFLLEIYVVASKAIYSNLVLTFMLYPLVASIMVLLLCNPIEKADKIGGFSRACANITYYSHPAVILLVEVLFKLQSPTLLFLLVTVISVGLGWLYKKLGIQEKILKLFNLGVKS